jgi:vancomycin aglycone glucosyltransferase
MRVLLSTIGSRGDVQPRGWADLPLVDDEPDCLAIGEANLKALFIRVAAVVHHGGARTTTLAALAGAPQVVIPQLYDQHYWAQRIHHLGIGTAHAPGTPTTDSLTSALAHALRPYVAARARSIATVQCAATEHRPPLGACSSPIHRAHSEIGSYLP